MNSNKNNQNEKLDELLTDNNKELIFGDKENKILKGNEDQDIRFNPNKNRREIDVVSKKNQLY